MPDVDFLDSDGHVDPRSCRGKNVVLVFHPGGGCADCSKQLKELTGRKNEFEKLETVVVVVRSGELAELAETLGEQELGSAILADRDLDAAKRFKAYDDFEEEPIPATVLIDKEGRVYWVRASHKPFMNFDF